MEEVRHRDNDWWFLEGLGSLFGQHLDVQGQNEFVREFNNSDSEFRESLARFVLPYFANVTTDRFSEDAISFLLADLRCESHSASSSGHLVGIAATEEFVTEYLVPLLPDAKEPLLGNLHAVLREAGSRHGRRYLVDLAR